MWTKYKKVIILAVSIIALDLRTKQLIIHHKMGRLVSDQVKEDVIEDVIQVSSKMTYFWQKSGFKIEQMLSYSFNNNKSEIFFLQLSDKDRIAGYALCQYYQETDYLVIRQLIIDPKLYQKRWLESVLFVCADLKPSMQRLSVWVFDQNLSMDQDLERIGFKQKNLMRFEGFDVETPISNDCQSCQCYSMEIMSKCMMCQILYGPDFWMQECEDGVCQDELNQNIQNND